MPQGPPLGEGELTSQRLFMPPPKAPRRVEVYTDLLAAMGLNVRARELALANMAVERGQNILHAGCGTGELALEIKRRWPDTEVEGADSDEAALETAAERAGAAGLRVLFQRGFLQDLPSTAERYDWVVCVLFLHRLRGEDRGFAFEELRRVLKPGGRLLVVDFGRPASGLGGWLVRRLSVHRPGIADHFQPGLGELCTIGGFEDVRTAQEGAFGLQAILGRR